MMQLGEKAGFLGKWLNQDKKIQKNPWANAHRDFINQSHIFAILHGVHF
jgi:hypothetical protein